MALNNCPGIFSLVLPKTKSHPLSWHKYLRARQSCFFLTGSYCLAKMSNLLPTTMIGISNGCTLARSSFCAHFSSTRCFNTSRVLEAGFALEISSITFYRCSLMELSQKRSESMELPGVDKSRTIQIAVLRMECWFKGAANKLERILPPPKNIIMMFISIPSS